MYDFGNQPKLERMSQLIEASQKNSVITNIPQFTIAKYDCQVDFVGNFRISMRFEGYLMKVAPPGP